MPKKKVSKYNPRYLEDPALYEGGRSGSPGLTEAPARTLEIHVNLLILQKIIPRCGNVFRALTRDVRKCSRSGERIR